MNNTEMYSVIENRILSQRRAKRRIAMLCCVCTLIAGVTGVMLIMPADTQSRETFCGFEEHIHSDECYEAVGEKQLICTIEEGTVTHEHTDACYEEQRSLVCTQEETEGHTHTDACYEQQAVLSCGQEETSGHAHTDACYAHQQVLSCTLPESAGHVHDAACYDAEGNLVCSVPEGEGAHTHDASCYTEETSLICGMAEGEGAHTHSDACYTQQSELICGQEEREAHAHTDACYQVEKVLTCTESAEPHVHTDACYHMEKILACDKPEHEHTLKCFANPTANLENPEIWERPFQTMEFTGNWRKDVISVAQTQLGYTESSANYIVDEFDDTRIHGYTRYGAWYGYPYSEWCAMFCSFVYHYAEVDSNVFPSSYHLCTDWVEALTRAQLWHSGDNYIPQPGDLIFFDTEKHDGLADHVGLVYNWNPDTGLLTTIEGNRIVAVDKFDYYLTDDTILGFGELPENPELAVKAQEELSAPTEVPAEEAEPVCTCGAEEGQPHAEDCPLYMPECTCGADEGEEHAEDCPVAIWQAKKAAEAAALAAEAEPACTCGAEEGQPHAEDCPLYVPECTCGAEEGEAHAEDCPVAIWQAKKAAEAAALAEVAEPTCTCGAEEGQPHTKDCPLYVPVPVEIRSAPASDGAVAVVNGILPEGAEVTIEAVTFTEDQLIAYFGAKRAAAMKNYVAYDIKIMVNGEEWQPDESVSVVVEHPAIEVAQGESFGVAHIDGVTDEVSTVKAEVSVEGDVSFTADAVVEAAPAPAATPEIQQAAALAPVAEVSFEAEGFSVYFFYTFTVDFHFGDITFCMEGRSQLLLSELFAELGILSNAADVYSVTFSDPSLVEVQQVEGDWLLISLEPFDTDESLYIEFNDGTVLIIAVTDAQTPVTYWEKVTDKSEFHIGGTYLLCYDGKIIGGPFSRIGNTAKCEAVDLYKLYTEPDSTPEAFAAMIPAEYKWTVSENTKSGYQHDKLGCCGYTLRPGANPILYETGLYDTWFESSHGDSTIFRIRNNNYSLKYDASNSTLSSASGSNGTKFTVYKLVDPSEMEAGTIRGNKSYTIDVYGILNNTKDGPVNTPVLLSSITLDSNNPSIDPEELFYQYKVAGDDLVIGEYLYSFYNGPDAVTPIDGVNVINPNPSFNNIKLIQYSETKTEQGMITDWKLTFTGPSATEVKEINSTNKNALYLVYQPIEMESGGNVGHDPKAPDHSKWIDALREGPDNPETELDNSVKDGTHTPQDTVCGIDDLYRLYLNIGPQTTYAAVDVLFIIDQSGSMETEDAQVKGESNLTARSRALRKILNGTGDSKGLIDTILNLNTLNRYSMIGFGSDTSGKIERGWSRSTEKVGYSEIKGDGGTNYEAAINKGITMLDSRFSKQGDDKYKENKVVVVFISDGVPTFYVPEGKTYAGPGNYTDPLVDEHTRQAIVRLRNYITSNDKSLPVYSIAIGDPDSGSSFNLEYLNLLSTSNSTFVSTDFDKISAQIDDMITTGVGHFTEMHIEDTLSDYVEFYTPMLDLKVLTWDEKTDEKTELYTASWVDGSLQGEFKNNLDSNGNPILNAENPVVISGNTIRVNFDANYEEKGGQMYSVSFNVRSTQKAYDTYANNYFADDTTSGYAGVKGQEDTDYKLQIHGDAVNSTSSYKPGFHSDTIQPDSKYAGEEYNYDGAFLTTLETFGDQSNIPQQAQYDHPVVQVSTTELTVTKEWTDDEDDPTKHNKDSVTVALYYRPDSLTDDNNTGNLDENGIDTSWTTVSALQTTLQKAKIDTGNWRVTSENWCASYKELPKGYKYRAVELNQEEIGYTAEYSETDGKITITNSPAKTDITLVKVDELKNVIPVEGVTFELYKDNNGVLGDKIVVVEDNRTVETYATGADGKITFTGLIIGESYWLKEITAPGGFNRLTEPHKFTVTSKTAAGKMDGDGTIIVDPDMLKEYEDETTKLIPQLAVINTSGYELPKTGGTGTTLYYISGSLLAGFALIYGCFAKQKKREGRHAKT